MPWVRWSSPTVAGSHSNFQAVIRTADFPAGSVDGGGNSFANGGGPFRLYTSSDKTTRLPVHVVKFVTGGSAEIEVWTSLPTQETGTEIYAEDDATETIQPAVTHTYGRNAVWVNDVARYHADESSGNLTDSTGNSNTAVAQNSPTYGEAGQIGDGVGVSNTGSNRFDITSTTDFDFSSLSSGYRIGLWIDLDASQPNWAGVVAKGDSANDFAFQRNSSTNDISVRHSSSSVTVTDGFNDFVGVGQVKLDLVWNKTHLNIYKNGALHSSTAFSDAPTYNATYPVKLGSERAGTCVNGTLDEIVFSKDFVPSADWLATEYDNQSASSGWFTVVTWSGDDSPIGLATETDTAHQISSSKAVSIGFASESDSALQATCSKARVADSAVESDSALSFARAKLRSILQSTETDSAFAVTSSGGVLIGQAVETDTAFSAASAKLRSIAQAIESDTGNSFAWVKLRDIGLASETDSAFAMSTIGNVPIGLALEVDTAQIVDILKTLGIGQASEIDSGFTVTSMKSRQIGLSLESEAAFNVSVSKQRTIGQSSEADTAFPFSSDGSVTVLIGLATEVDSAFAAARNKTRAISLGSETDSAFDMAALFSGAIGRASEADSAFSVGRSKSTLIGLATETDTALIFTSDSVITVRAPSGTGYSPGRVISVRPAQKYPIRIH